MRSAVPALLALFAAGCPGAPAKRVEKPKPKPPAEPVDPPGPPVAARKTVTDTYQGGTVPVDDPYRWLEADDADVQAWSDGQNQWARGILDKLPERAAIRSELQAYYEAPITKYYELVPAGKALFGLRKDPAKQQPELVVLADPAKPEDAHLVLDPTAGGDATQAIDWFVPSPDGSRVALSVSVGGSETGTLHIIDLQGADVEPPIANVQRGTGGGDVAWLPDGKHLLYTRYPGPGEPHDDEPDQWMHVWSHEIGGRREDDTDELGEGLPPVSEIQLEADAKGRVIATVQNGDGGEFRHYLRDKKGVWTQLTDWGDHVVWIGFGAGTDLLAVSKRNAPHGTVLKLTGSKPSLAKARTLIAQGADTIITDFYTGKGITVGKDRLWISYQVGGPSELRSFSLAGKPGKPVQTPPVSAVGWPVPWKTGALVAASSYVTPPAWYQVDGKTGAVTVLEGLLPKPPMDLSDFEVRREQATSKDGTKVPLNVIWPKNAPQDGSVPCVITGYGGFNSSQEPGFLAGDAPLLKRGMCYVEVNLRGGGEFGEEWHRAGMLTQKQNVFDDFAAAIDYLIGESYTRRERIALIGGSNGGLLMGAMLTQHPELARVVVSYVGIYDMLRNELTPNGKYNTSEYGSVNDPDQFKALYAYSPYHHVPMGARFPAVLFLTGANDPRVAPWHSRKMIAALQHANAGDAPILLRTSASSGHGIGTAMSERLDSEADVFAFILSQLGI
jgi:prolyl oligopeptidase